MNDLWLLWIGLLYYFIGVTWSVHSGRRKIRHREANGLEGWFLFYLLIQAVLWPFGMLDRYCFDQDEDPT